MPHTSRSTLFSFSAGLILALGSAGSASAVLISQHLGSNDPLTEGFGLWPFNGGISTAALPNDLGEAAWQISNTGGSQQAAYLQLGGTGPFLGGSGLSQPEIDDIIANGFTLSLRARVVGGPVYDESGTQRVSAVISVAGFSGFRFDIGLGRDALGNTIVVVPQLINFVNPSFEHQPFGSTFLLPGNGYRLYQLSYDPVTLTASLLVDGVVMLTGYPGSAVSGGTVANNFGLVFAAINLATVNVAEATLESGEISGPLPAVAVADWSAAFALQGQPPGGQTVSPMVLAGFNPQGQPVTLDLSDPLVALMSAFGVSPTPFIQLNLAAYGAIGVDPVPFLPTVVGNRLDFPLDDGMGTTNTLRIELTASGGELIDPGGLVGFNPVPEPPDGDIVGFNPVPEPPKALGLLVPMVGGALGPGPSTFTMSVEILDAGGTPMPLVLVTPVLPLLGPWGVAVLAGVLGAMGLAASRRSRPR